MWLWAMIGIFILFVCLLPECVSFPIYKNSFIYSSELMSFFFQDFCSYCVVKPQMFFTPIHMCKIRVGILVSFNSKKGYVAIILTVKRIFHALIILSRHCRNTNVPIRWLIITKSQPPPPQAVFSCQGQMVIDFQPFQQHTVFLCTCPCVCLSVFVRCCNYFNTVC